MVVWIVLLVILALAAFGYYGGKRRALTAAAHSGRPLHSLPGYYGYYVALWCALPALALLAVWLVLEPRIVEWLLVSALGADQRALPPEQLGLMLSDIRNLARGDVTSHGEGIDPAW